MTSPGGTELEALEKLIADHGYYPYQAEPGEVEALQAEGKLDALFLELMRERLTAWLTLADERLRPLDKPLYFMLGNDDPVELAALLDAAPWGQNAEGRVLRFDDDHELISWGFSNITPLAQSPRADRAAADGVARADGDVAGRPQPGRRQHPRPALRQSAG